LTKSVDQPTRSPPRVVELVRRFKDGQESYHSGAYDEANLRQEFLNPFFAQLGWDMENVADAADAYKDVVYEHRTRGGSRTDIYDYLFRVGGNPKFVVEAKKPSINLLSDPEPALQLRRYGWNRKFPLCILTNFEVLSIYDTRIPPKDGDPAKTGRVKSIGFEEYETRWGEISQIFGKESILKGRFDREAGRKARPGTDEVDDVFLSEIERWRSDLATNLKLRNQELDQAKVNFAVQAVINRIVFLRICEDRGVEPPGRLQSCAKGSGVYSRLVELFQEADEKYDSGLFHFHPERKRRSPEDGLTPSLTIDDTILRALISDLYPPISSYDFSVMPVEILGQVYEQFLRSVIVVTDKRARVEQKPEVRKAHGVYYTPTFVVDYIVRNTLGKALDGQTPDTASEIRIVDPACGSGSFLLGAYQYLLDWHLRLYSASPRKWKGRVVQTGPNSYALVARERTRILLNNIYGVDIDPQAVEVTKLSLLLKALEKTPGEVIERQLRLTHERALPDLDPNIRCGNSLIAPDFYSARQTTLDSNELAMRVNVFDWRAEFPGVFERDNPGFDVVVGNPPYIPPELVADEEKRYIKTHHPELSRKYDSSIVFILSMPEKLRQGGALGFISSVTWQTGENFNDVRRVLFTKFGLEQLVNLPWDIFRDAYVDTCLYVIRPSPLAKYGLFRFPKKLRSPDMPSIGLVPVPYDLVTPPEYKLVLDPMAHALLRRLQSDVRFVPLGELTQSTQGLAGNRFSTREEAAGPAWYPYLIQGQVHRYSTDFEKLGFADMGPHRTLRPYYEAGPKILIRRVISRDDRIQSAFFDGKMVFKKDINPFKITDEGWDPRYILAILNSRLTSYLYLNTSSVATKDDFRQTTLAELRRLPIRRISSDDRDLVGVRDRLSQLAITAEELGVSGKRSQTMHERESVERRMAAVETEIDQLVFRLYEVAEDERQRIAESRG
jgi:hypothetical protein